MRVFRAVFQVSTGPASNLGQDLAMSHAIVLQPVRDDTAGLEPQTSQQAFEKALRGCSVPPVLHQDVEHDAVLVRCAPKIMQHAVDA
jgi:hypothetical protein